MIARNIKQTCMYSFLYRSLLFSAFLSFSIFNVYSKTTRSNGTGNWNSSGTWTNGIPGAGDSAIVRNGDVVTVTQNESCAYLILVGSNSGTSRVTVNSGQTLSISVLLQTAATAANQTVDLNVVGDVSASGAIAFLYQRDTNVTSGTWQDDFTVNFSGGGYMDIDRIYPYGELNLNVNTSCDIECNRWIQRTNFSSSTTTVSIQDSLYITERIELIGNSSTAAANRLGYDHANGVIAFSFGANVITSGVGGIIDGGSNGRFHYLNSTSIITSSYMSYNDVQISRQATVSLSSALTLGGQLIISNGTTFNPNGQSMSIGGITNNGTLSNLSSGNVTVTGSSGLLTGSAFNFGNLIINSSGSVTVDLSGSDSCIISGSLEIQNGTFNTGNRVRLLDNGSGLAPIKEITGSGSIFGDVTMQFRIGSNSSKLSNVDYRQITMPLSGQTISSVQYNSGTRDYGFYTYGFTGSNYTGGSVASTYFYDNTGISSASDGWSGATNSTNTLGHQQGASFYCGPGSGSGNKDFYFAEVSGTPNQGTQKINSTNGAKMSFHNNTDLDWALVGNPFACEISTAGIFNGSCAGETAANGGGTSVWIMAPDAGGYTVRRSEVPPFQAFWVHISAASPELTIEEGDKTNSQTTFLKSVKPKDELVVNLYQGSSSSSLYNFGLIRFNELATSKFELGKDDGDKRNPYPFPDVSMVSSDDKLLSIYATNPDADHIEIPILTRTYSSGTHTLKIDNLDLVEGCVILEDLLDKNNKVLSANDNEYTFQLSDTAASTRFVLHVYNFTEEVSTVNSTCYGENSGRVELKLYDHGSSSIVDIYDANDVMVSSKFDAKGKVTTNNLAPGNYHAEITNSSFSCAAQEEIFTIFEPGEMKPNFDFADQVLSFKTHQEISFENNSKGAIKSYEWNFGDGNTSSVTSPKHTFMTPGIHEITLTAQNGNDDCDVKTSRSIEVVDKYLSVEDELFNPQGFRAFVHADELVIGFNEPLREKTELKLIDLQGKTLHELSLNKGSIERKISVVDIPHVFILQIPKWKETSSLKLIH